MGSETIRNAFANAGVNRQMLTALKSWWILGERLLKHYRREVKTGLRVDTEIAIDALEKCQPITFYNG
jgi:hypothetical protein